MKFAALGSTLSALILGSLRGKANSLVQPATLAGAFCRAGGSGVGTSSSLQLDLRDNGSACANESGIDIAKNTKFIEGLIENLTDNCDRYILNGSPTALTQAQNLLSTIQLESNDEELAKKAGRVLQRAGIPAKPQIELGRNDEKERRAQSADRQRWEEERKSGATNGRSALTRRIPGNSRTPSELSSMAQEIKDFNEGQTKAPVAQTSNSTQETLSEQATSKVSELIARAGAKSSFLGTNLGIGGLDEVLAEVKRRVWTPLAVPPRLLSELGISPVRGLLLYGKPGNGKTLLARKLGQILSPLRPITVVSGPEVLDKFVGSSEKNLRELFDNPPDIYDTFRIGQPDGGSALAKAALHLIVMDEFDAIARARGGQGGKGDQGDAGVARDSVVNQLLAKMDGVDPLPVPTLVVGLTNKRSLIDPALLRAGRFEIQIEVPPPKTSEQRASILRVHTLDMFNAGRMLVDDAPPRSPAKSLSEEELPAFDELLWSLAEACEDFSGAALAGLARAAASHALERAVDDFMENPDNTSSLNDCVVTRLDFDAALSDMRSGLSNSDWEEDTEESSESSSENNTSENVES